MTKKITLSDVNKRNLKIIAYLIGSWAVALGLVYITKDERLVGLAPVLNVIAAIIQKELSHEGYVRALKK